MGNKGHNAQKTVGAFSGTSVPGPPQATLACRTSRVHSHALEDLQAAKSSFDCALECLAHRDLLSAADFVMEGKAKARNGLSHLPSLLFVNRDLHEAVKSTTKGEFYPGTSVDMDREVTTVQREIKTVLFLMEKAMETVEYNKNHYDKVFNSV